MGEQTAISWCRHTFNPWIGCTKISVGDHGACEGCYAEVATPSRALGVLWGNHERHRTAPSNWSQPRKWDREAAAAGEPRFVFCASLADVFDNQVPWEWRRDLFELIRATPNLTWLLLTKRPGNILSLFREADGQYTGARGFAEDHWPRNAAIGCTVVTQEEADRDIPKLLAAKAALKPAFAFLSMEPLLGQVDLTPYLRTWVCRVCEYDSAESKWLGKPDICPMCAGDSGSDGAIRWDGGGLDWVITGGETDQGGHKARPTHPDWFRGLRDQCAAAGVPFHHKQNGEWAASGPHNRDAVIDFEAGRVVPQANQVLLENGSGKGGRTLITKIGKKSSGRLLDGVLHDAMPAVR